MLALAPFHSFTEFEDLGETEKLCIIFSVLALPVFMFAGQLLRGSVVLKFGRVTGRTALRKPEGRPPKALEALATVQPAPT